MNVERSESSESSESSEASNAPPVHDLRGERLAEARDAAARRRPAQLLAQWADDGLVAPSPVDLRASVALDALALAAAPDHDALLLSPVAPLGATSVLGPTSQDRVLSTIRPVEVVSDPTNVLALEAARRLRAATDDVVRLCTVHQTLRMQPAPAGRGRTRHFRMFALADAGRARADDGFEVDAVLGQLAAFRRLLDAAAAAGFGAGVGARAIVRADAGRTVLGDRVAAAIAAEWAEVDVVREELVNAYYGGLRVGYGVHGRDGAFVELVDLGCFDWVAQLTADRRNRFVAGAIGIQLLPLLFA
ncbi:hypothetical protein [Agromyces sp. Leaf222]|uniref:hypothetical protein n=1 Tax=Agromyces sp. Leaf222 TaxID=1735688 RepID=UPI00070084EC|nr:hypothetical protein [Agromyces sp. Leaf222]KQM82532.1 hypothetical protein ASE68_03930 [Agromyces sp. Leaf222]